VHLTRAEIDLGALRHNLAEIRRRVGPGRKIMGVVKANAYGHGLVEVARELTRGGCEYLGVAYLAEAVRLRAEGVKTPVLAMAGVLGDQVREFLEHDIDISVASVEIGRRVSEESTKLGKKAKVHLKVDTGMGRLGVQSAHAVAFAEQVAALPGVEIVGLFSHFATADDPDPAFAREQLGRFHDLADQLAQRGFAIPLKHMANSAATMRFPDALFDMVRPGIALYGYLPHEELETDLTLRPVLALKSRIVYLKEVPPGTSISYGRKYTTAAQARIATIPIGYADGFSRSLTNRAELLVGGKRFRVAGTVCMDQIMIDAGMGDALRVGDEVVLIGASGAESITAWDLAKLQGTIPYEILTAITARVPRVFLN
jgi:alanine racemase